MFNRNWKMEPLSPQATSWAGVIEPQIVDSTCKEPSSFTAVCHTNTSYFLFTSYFYDNDLIYIGVYSLQFLDLIEKNL